MTKNDFPLGLEMDVSYPNFEVSLTLLSLEKMRFEIKEGPFARIETVDIEVVPLGNSVFAVSWQEQSGATVTNIQDYDRSLVFSFATLPNGQFLRMTGTMAITRPTHRTSDDRPHRNKALVLEAMTSLFQRHDASAVDRLYALDYIQHNPSIPQGRDALRTIVEGLPEHVHYEPGLIIADGDLVAIHGRIRGWADEPQIAIDIFRVEDGKLAEHWDVLQNEVTATAAGSGIAMFDPEEARPRAQPRPGQAAGS
ncbi:nuclear transport factor 2 family protein [Kaistia dalseonensis]|uniref:SnoaL-like aldol condensation-catalyzing enzyme n=1 Tax=Kaistia dalseonensis TaxID=410840 RepID=A0ABU0H9I4_9HYPH|nr:nuclear transport factor 2 family protein [Kaistia dalseonensis]MCX5496361.1 nuclear transport factor 2 family protein [Kaistia dalseonensis]MDQ0438982.1 putative SnoaL-like aldol condensation-catalyzing enzyme [Kaistia dalseonensis]